MAKSDDENFDADAEFVVFDEKGLDAASLTRLGLRTVSLCDGMSGITRINQLLGSPMGIVASAEIDPEPAAVAAANAPTTTQIGDMLNKEAMLAHASDIALQVSGTPCQSFSLAGNRQGIAHVNGRLALVDIEHFHASKADIKLWENVFGALSSNDGEDFACLLGHLIGYGKPLPVPKGGWPKAGVASGPLCWVAYRITNAKGYGTAQARRRVWMVAVKSAAFNAQTGYPWNMLFEDRKGGRRSTSWFLHKALIKDIADMSGEWFQFWGNESKKDAETFYGDLHCGEFPVNPVFARLSDVMHTGFIPKSYDLNGSAALNILARAAKHKKALPTMLSAALYEAAAFDIAGISVAAKSPAECDKLRAKHKRGFLPRDVVEMNEHAEDELTFAIYSVCESTIYGTAAGGGAHYFNGDQTTKHAEEVVGTLRAGQGGAAKNSVAYPVCMKNQLNGYSIPKDGRKNACTKEDESYCLTASDHHAVAYTECAQASSDEAVSKAQAIVDLLDRGAEPLEIIGFIREFLVDRDRCYRVRRLTEWECSRLQGFPDDWMVKAVAPEGKRFEGDAEAVSRMLADDGVDISPDVIRTGPRSSAMYKMVGNGWSIHQALPVVRGIIRGWM